MCLWNCQYVTEAFLRALRCDTFYLCQFGRCHLIKWVALPTHQMPSKCLPKACRREKKTSHFLGLGVRVNQRAYDDFLRMLFGHYCGWQLVHEACSLHFMSSGIKSSESQRCPVIFCSKCYFNEVYRRESVQGWYGTPHHQGPILFPACFSAVCDFHSQVHFMVQVCCWCFNLSVGKRMGGEEHAHPPSLPLRRLPISFFRILWRGYT